MSLRAEVKVIASFLLMLGGVGVLSALLHKDRATDFDKDGIPDDLESPASILYPDSSPQHRDLYVDIFVQPGALLLNATVANSIWDYFGQAPVINPDGTQGVSLHWRVQPIYGPVADTVNESGASFQGHHIPVFFEDKFCLARPERACQVAGQAYSNPVWVEVAAKRLVLNATDGLQPRRDALRQQEIRQVLMHELEHLLWWNKPAAVRAGPDNPHHTNILGDALCEPPVVPPDGLPPSVPGCDADGHPTYERWHYAAIFWRQKETESFLPQPTGAPGSAI